MVPIEVPFIFYHFQIIGLQVDNVAEVVGVEYSDIEAAPNFGRRDTSRYIDGVVNRDGQLLIIVSLDKLMTEPGLGEVEGF